MSASGSQRRRLAQPHALAGCTIRHSVYYSIIDSEWPAVKALLEGKWIFRLKKMLISVAKRRNQHQ